MLWPCIFPGVREVGRTANLAFLWVLTEIFDLQKNMESGRVTGKCSPGNGAKRNKRGYSFRGVQTGLLAEQAKLSDRFL